MIPSASMPCTQGRRNSSRAAGAVKKVRTMKTYENKKIVTNCACYCSTTMLTSKIIKETVDNLFQFDLDKSSNCLWCCHEKDTLLPLSLFCTVRGKYHCSPASLLTTISSHCLAALPAKMSEFSSYMGQNVYYRNLKWTLEDLLACYCYTIKTNSKTILASLATWPCRQRNGHKWTASSPLQDTSTVKLAFV